MHTGYAAHHTKNYEGQNGFWIRRIYLTFDHNFENNLSGRLRLEANQKDFTSASDTMNPFLKDAFLEWKYKEGHSALFGLSGRPGFEEVESFWGYRAVEKIPIDLQKWTGSRDTGIALRGRFGANQVYGYHAMFGNGNDTKQETDRHKKAYLALDAKLTKTWYGMVSGDFEQNKDNTSGSSWYTFQGFIGWKTETKRAGFNYAHQVRERTTARYLNLDIFSIFGVAKLSERCSIFGRLDYHMDPNPQANTISYFGLSNSGTTNTNASKNTLLIFGADHTLNNSPIHIMPNIEIFFFGENTTSNRPNSVIIPRITVFYKF